MPQVPFYIEINVPGEGGERVWVKVRPSGPSAPYAYPSAHEACWQAGRLYPGLALGSEVRIVDANQTVVIPRQYERGFYVEIRHGGAWSKVVHVLDEDCRDYHPQYGEPIHHGDFDAAWKRALTMGLPPDATWRVVNEKGETQC